MSSRPVLQVRRLPGARVPLPAYQSEGAAGLDLHAALEGPLVLAPGERRLVPTGVALALPPGHEGQIRPRSGLALRYGLGMVNAPGTIDEDYRGEVGVLLVNLGAEPVTLEPGQRIAQLVVCPVARVVVEEQATLDPTPRGGRGFGSTGS